MQAAITPTTRSAVIRPAYLTGPQFAAYVFAGIIALSFGHDLMRKPIQVSDSLQELLDVQQSPSLWATVVAHSPRGPFLRPLRQVQIKTLFDLADGRYQLAFRGFHAFLVALALFLFVRALQVQTWADVAAAVFALTVLTGIHTFRGTVREAFPINHFLEVVVFCLIALNLAQGRVAPRPDRPVLAGRSASADRHGGWWVDVAAAATFIVASLTLESGPLVWVVAVAAWACGMRGISGRGIVAMTGLLAAYLWLRFVYLSVGTPGLDVGRDSGFGAAMLPPEEIVRRFADNPAPFYLYNVVTSVLSVLFSDPDRGVFHTLRTWREGVMPARLYIAIIPSLITTALIVWVTAARLRARAWENPLRHDQLLFVFAVVLFANAVFAYAYAKHEIISVAGAFYAFAAFVAMRHVIGSGGLPFDFAQGTPSDSRAVKASGYHGWRGARVGLCLLLGALAAAWAFRSAGVHHMLQTQAFRERLEWARLDPDKIADRGYPSDARARALAAQLRREALDLRIANPSELPAWADDWWGE
jgi:hypothetical protein